MAVSETEPTDIIAALLVRVEPVRDGHHNRPSIVPTDLNCPLVADCSTCAVKTLPLMRLNVRTKYIVHFKV